MTKTKFIPLALIAIFLSQHLPTALAESESADIQKITLHKNGAGPVYREGEVIVKYKKNRINLEKNADQTKVIDFENSKKLQQITAIREFNAKILKSEKDTSQTIQDLEKDPNVESVQPNYIKQLSAVPNDPNFAPYQWALQNTGQTITNSNNIGTTTGKVDADIDAPEAWDFEGSSAQEIVVAVIDTGARITHEDLTANIWTNTDEIPSNGIDDDNNGYVDDVHGWDFKDNDNNPDDSAFLINSEDFSGHGTFISGLIGGVSNNSKGISGTSMKNKIKIMPLRFNLDSASEIAAINYAKNNGAMVINASFGASTIDPAEQSALGSFPGIIAAAAGNNGISNETNHFYPSDYTNDNIISVAATDQNDALASFSNYGNVSVDLGAPGKNIISTYHKNSSNVDSNISYAIGDGTSFAAPYVAASIAFLLSAKPSSTALQIKNIFLASGDTLPSLVGKTVSGKRLNLRSAYLMATKVSAPVPSVPGGTYSSSQLVTLTSETADATIHYTLDGSDPTTSSTKYSSPINISVDTTLKAIAVKTGFANSDISSNNYNFISPTSIFRFWSDKNQHHFFTASESEKDYIISHYPSEVWRYEGIGFKAFSSNASGMGAIYRFWSDKNQSHFFTASESEKDYIISHYPSEVWRYEGIGFYTYLNKTDNSIPVYRFWSDTLQGHFYTASEIEKNYIISNYPSNIWRYEGVAFYVPKQ